MIIGSYLQSIDEISFTSYFPHVDEDDGLPIRQGTSKMWIRRTSRSITASREPFNQ
jgi:hypothetical protein